MTRFARPSAQFGFVSRNFTKLNTAQRSLLRRTDYRGTYFNDDGAAQSAEESAALMIGPGEQGPPLPEIAEINELKIDWSEAEGVELTGVTYLTLVMDGQDLLKFRVGDDHHFMFYSNTRNLVDVAGVIIKE